MNLPQNATRKGWTLTVAASLAAMSLTSGAVFAQAKPAARGVVAGAAGAGAGAAAAAAPEATIEDKVMGALASREMDALLDYYFKKHNVPEEKQAVVKSIVAWRELANPNITAGRKRALLLDGVRGVKNFLASTRDTEMLMRRANELIEYGMKGQINQIEYFGESAGRQAELNGSAEAVVKILDKTAEECEAQQNQVLAGQVKPNPALLAKWQTLDERAQTAKWTKAFASYGLALSLDAANPRRAETADAAITFLTEFEKPEFQREVSVKGQLGKLLMVKGDAAGAVAKFAEVLKVKGVDKGGEYEAHFFTALANLTGRNEAAAVQSLAALQKWAGENLKPEEQKSVAPGIALLDYRVNEMRAELAKAPADKKKFTDAGEAVLSKLMRDNPKLEPVIKKMLLEKMPADADITKLEPVLLRALLAKGVDEVVRAKEGTADEKGKPVIERAIRVAAELQKRAGQPNVTEDVVDEASFLEPIFYAKLGKNVESVEESLDYLKAHGKNKERASNALANALAVVEVLRKSPESTGERIGGLINRTWEAAVAAGMKEYSFVYGKRLFDQGKFREAAAALKQTPPNHPALTHARFYELSSLQQLLDEKDLDAGAKKALVADIQKLAGEVNGRIDADLATAKEEQKPRLRFYQVSATLLSADLMQKELKDNAGVIKLLEGFEAKAKGLPKEDKLIGTTLRLRVNAYMALGKTQDAVDEVKKLVAQGGGNSANILYTLIQQMDDAYVKAKRNNDTETMKQNSAAQVALIGPLIEQTTDAKAKGAYEEWEASLLIRTARVEDDAARRAGYLTKAQGVFARQLGKAEEGTPKHDNYRYQLALISYELKDYKKVQQEMGQLIADGKLGPPDIRETNPADGTDTFKENPVYWEGLLRFMQSNWELAKTDNSPQLQEAVANAKETVKTLYINRGKNVGGDRLRDEYAKLKADMLPGWDETKISATTQPAAAAQPAATPKK